MSSKHEQQARSDSNDLPGDILIAMTETGYTDDVIGLQWIQHFVNKSRRSSQLVADTMLSGYQHDIWVILSEVYLQGSLYKLVLLIG
jgi:hypothetical protein